MMDLQQAKQELRQCSYLMLEIEDIEDLIKRKMAKLETQAMQLTDMPKSGSNKDRMLSTLGSVEELKDLKELAYYNDQIQKVESKISQIEKSQERTLLRMRYLKNLSFKMIAYKFNLSDRHIHRLHSNALISYSMLT